MPLSKVDATKIQAGWHRFAVHLNNQTPAIVKTRDIIKDKENNTKVQQKYSAVDRPLKKSVIHTGSFIISRYLNTYFQVYNNKFLSDAYADGGLPPLFTNCVSLAKEAGCSDRTMRTHIRKLKEVGLIVGYKTHGTRHDFELCISAKFLWPTFDFTPTPAKTQLCKNTLETPFSPPNCTDFPLISVQATYNNVEKEISNVCIKGAAMPQGALPGGESTSALQATSKASDPEPQEAAIPENPGHSRSLEVERPAQLTHTRGAAKSTLTAAYQKLVLDFFLYAWKMLYPTIKFSEGEQKEAMEAITAGVYANFQGDWSLERWENYQADLRQRIDIVHGYYNHPKHLHESPPLPYSRYKPGAGYFDQANEKGFKNSYQWLLVRKKWQKENQQNYLISKATKVLNLHAAGKGPKRILEMDRMQLFRQFENQIKPFGKAQLERFYKQIGIKANA